MAPPRYRDAPPLHTHTHTHMHTYTQHRHTHTHTLTLSFSLLIATLSPHYHGGHKIWPQLQLWPPSLWITPPHLPLPLWYVSLGVWI